jgi:glycosyltransferase involved in cell wall biosynthesis
MTIETQRPYVLVITPSYNRASLLPAAIESVLAQDYPYKKMAIIDDGSTDNTEEICRLYMNTHPQTISYYRKKNSGCASARNFGLDLMDDSIGYVCFLDSDDRMLPGKLSREINILQKNPEAGFSYSDTVYYLENKHVEIREKPAAYLDPCRFAVEHFLTNRTSSGAILYKSEILSGKRFDESMLFNEDSEFLERIAIENRCVYMPVPGAWVRIHEGSKSQDRIGINRAVLYASLKILAAYPTFYQSAPALFDGRIKQIKRQLFTEHMLDSQWEEAAKYASGVIESFFVKARFSVYYRSVAFMKRKISGAFVRYRIMWKTFIPTGNDNEYQRNLQK